MLWASAAQLLRGSPLLLPYLLLLCRCFLQIAAIICKTLLCLFLSHGHLCRFLSLHHHCLCGGQGGGEKEIETSQGSSMLEKPVPGNWQKFQQICITLVQSSTPFKYGVQTFPSAHVFFAACKCPYQYNFCLRSFELFIVCTQKSSAS